MIISRKEANILSDIIKQRYTLLYLLLCADLVFIVLYGFYGFRYLSDPKFGLIEDWSYGEIFQYIKEFWIVILLLALTIRKRSLLYFSWSMLFLYLLLDDSLQIHETIGALTATTFDFRPMFGLRDVDFGELTVAAIAGSILGSFIAVNHRHGDDGSRFISKCLFVLLIALLLFGIVLDMAGILVTSKFLTQVLGAIEDGGEQAVMSVIFWFVFMLMENHTVVK